MPINRTDIRMKESQRLDDTDYGGGQLTLNDVVSGEMNNLFPDISRMDRTYGRVSMRKAYMHVETSDRSTYYGAHAVLTKNAKDPHVSVCFFSDESFFSQRKEAQNRMESYLIRGPQLMAALYGNYTKNMGEITLHAPTTLRAPSIGDVLVLVANSGTSNEFQQFVRTTRVNERVENLPFGDNATIRKKIIDIELSTVLEYDFQGTELFQGVGGYSPKLETCIYTSTIADAASYYGVADLELDATKGDSSIKITDMQVPLLPYTSSESNVTNVGVDGSTVVSTYELTDKDSSTVTITKDISYRLSPNSSFHVGTPVQKGSLSLRISGTTFSDNGKGDIVNTASVHVGSIDYTTGIISFGSSAPSSTGTGSISYIPAVKFTQPSISAAIKIGIDNRGFNYTYICDPVPTAGSLTVHFLVDNKWYILQDKGNGELKGVEDSVGAGIVNLSTGSVSLTLGALPDVGSSILLLWAKKDRVIDLSGDDYDLQFDFVLDPKGVARNSFVCSWKEGAYAVKDDGNTNLYVATNNSGDWYIANSAEKVGTINYSSGRVVFKPGTLQELPSCMEKFLVQYSCGTQEEETFTAPALLPDGTVSLKVKHAPIQKGSFEIEWHTLLQKYGTESSTSDIAVGAKQTVQLAPVDPTHIYVDEPDEENTNIGHFRGEIKDFSLLKTEKLIEVNERLATGESLENMEYAAGDNEILSTINYSTGEIKFMPTRKGFFPVPSYEWRDTGRVFIEDGTQEIQTMYGTTTINTQVYKKEQEYSFSHTEYKLTACVFPESGSVKVKYRRRNDGDTQKEYYVDVQYSFIIKPSYKCQFVPGSVQLLAGGVHLADVGNGELHYDIASVNGLGQICGKVDYINKIITITTDNVLTSKGSVVPMDIRKIRVVSAVGTNNIEPVSFLVFRTPGAPLTPRSVQIKASIVPSDGSATSTTVVGMSDNYGRIYAEQGGVEGTVDYTTGLCQAYFGKWVPVADFDGEKPLWFDKAVKSEDGTQVWQPYSVLASSIFMTCTVTSYIALNSKILGINPIRLPIDGKVPIFRRGDVVLVHRTGEYNIGTFAGEAATIKVGETMLGDLAVYDKNGKYFPEITGGAYCPTGSENKRNYTVDLAKGEIKTSGSFDFNIYDKPKTGGVYEQYESPFTALYRVEDMLLCVDTQINGTLGLNQPLQHDYPANETRVSSVLPCGDLQAGAYGEFIQSNWTGVWSDDPIGNKPDASYDFTRSPIQIDNRGGIKERWAIRFTSDKTIDVIGEGLGVIIAGLTIDTNNEFGTPNGLDNITIMEANLDISGGFAVEGGVKDLVQIGGGWYKKNNKYILQAISRYTNRPYWSIAYDGFSTGWRAGNCIRFNTVAASMPFWFIRTTLQFPAEENTDKYQFLMRGDSV